MKTAVIVHGTCSREEYFSDEYPSLSNSHWLPWLHKQFLMAGYLSFTPEIPDAYLPDYQNWRREFERCPVSSSSILVGHSCGGGFLLRWLSENRLKVARLVLVAPWVDPGHRKTADFFEFSIDPAICDRTDVHLLESLTDMSEVKQSIALIRAALPGLTYHQFENSGHFCFSDLGTHRFPKLREIAVDGSKS